MHGVRKSSRIQRKWECVREATPKSATIKVELEWVVWDGIKRNEIHQIRRDWPDGLGLEGKRGVQGEKEERVSE